MPESNPQRINELHKNQILLFQSAVGTLQDLLKNREVTEVLYSGTMTTQSGATSVMIAPVRRGKKRTVEDVVNGPTPYAVLYTAGSLKLLRTKTNLEAGAYLLVFQNGSRGWDTHIVDATGRAAAKVTTNEVAFERGDKEDLIEKAKKLAKKRGLDVKLVDIEVEFNGSSEVFVSFLFWRWSLFEDPALPYLGRAHS